MLSVVAVATSVAFCCCGRCFPALDFDLLFDFPFYLRFPPHHLRWIMLFVVGFGVGERMGEREANKRKRRRRRRRRIKETEKERKRKKKGGEDGREREQPGVKGSFCAKIKATNSLTHLTNRLHPKWHSNSKYAKLWHS